MKKAQSPLGVVIGLFVLIVILVVFIFVFRPPSTGQVISEFENDSLEQKVLEESNYVEFPFELRAWVISETGVSIDARNKGTEAYIVKVFDVSNCGAANQDSLVIVGESKILKVKCDLKKGDEFEGDIKIIYSTANSQETLVSKGKLKDVV